MKKRTPRTAPVPVFSVYKYDRFTQKYRICNGNENEYLGYEVYLNPPLRQQIATNAARPQMVIAKRLNSIFTGLRRVPCEKLFVGNLTPKYHGTKKRSLVVAFSGELNGEKMLFVWFYSDFHPSPTGRGFDRETLFVKANIQSYRNDGAEFISLKQLSND